MNESLIRIGVVGCGEHSFENLLPSLWSLSSVTVVGLCDSDPDATKRAAVRFPSATVFRNYADLLSQGNIDAVVAAASPEVHFDVARQALQRGFHVFVEKPPTITTSELRLLSALAKHSQLVTGVGHNLRHASASRQLQQRIKNPQFGRPSCMDMRYFASKPRGVRWGLESPLKSFLLSHANHALDLMVYQLGAVDSVSAIGSIDTNGSIALAVQMRFANGAIGNLLATSGAPHFSLSATVVGEHSTIVHMEGLSTITEYSATEKRWGRQWVERTLDSGFEHAGYQTELNLFVAAIGQTDRMHPSFEEEVAVYELIDNIEQQVTTGTVASIADRP